MDTTLVIILVMSCVGAGLGLLSWLLRRLERREQQRCDAIQAKIEQVKESLTMLETLVDAVHDATTSSVATVAGSLHSDAIVANMSSMLDGLEAIGNVATGADAGPPPRPIPAPSPQISLMRISLIGRQGLPVETNWALPAHDIYQPGEPEDLQHYRGRHQCEPLVLELTVDSDQLESLRASLETHEWSLRLRHRGVQEHRVFAVRLSVDEPVGSQVEVRVLCGVTRQQIVNNVILHRLMQALMRERQAQARRPGDSLQDEHRRIRDEWAARRTDGMSTRPTPRTPDDRPRRLITE